ncbi:MAG: TetR/AcrR family transcriptional regulator [Sphingomonadales bacterium]|nr:TetR/AcrR family transcriptional regulator [Sphingomonadales bacterium]MBU3991955.1 TetR/AcrR family transcriptional regulator [Alphaproteobacteria bacterium]
MNRNSSNHRKDLPFDDAAPPGSLRAEQKQLTRRRIVQAARTCFLADGVAETGFNEIARRAGVSRATVYLHFPGKQPLLLALLEEDWEAQRVLFASAPWPTDSELAGAFSRWLARMVKAYRARRESMGLYALVIAQDPATHLRLSEQRRALLAELGSRFPAFAVAGEADPERRVAAFLMLSQIEQFCMLATIENWGAEAVAGADLLGRAIAAFVAPR